MGYRNLDVAKTPDPFAACASSCCAWDACTAWIVRNFTGRDFNCTNTLCCWLKPRCAETSPLAGAVSAFRALPLPSPRSGYQVLLNTTDDMLTLTRLEGGARAELGRFPLASLENGLVRGAWNLLRVVAEPQAGGEKLSLSVFFNPMFPETGFVGNASDAFRAPLPIRPRLSAVDSAPLSPGEVAVGAGGGPANIDYISALPLSVR